MSKIIYTEIEFLEEIKNETEVFVLVDENTKLHCYPLLQNQLPEHQLIEISSGELSKSMSTVEYICAQLLEYTASRNAILINVGGGVITDIGGFAAGIYKRGIRCINIPTTLMGMVDASFGGKTGIDFEGHKNMLGLFNQAECIYINSDFLNTLELRQIRSGFAEMLKHGLIADRKYWNQLLQVDTSNVNEIKQHIAHSIQIKMHIVLSDPTDQGNRKLLNFGHTFGHAIESYFLTTSEPLLHGEAIALGILLESKISLQKSTLNERDYLEIESVLYEVFGELMDIEIDLDLIWPYMTNDKKNADGNISFMVLKSIGNAQLGN